MRINRLYYSVQKFQGLLCKTIKFHSITSHIFIAMLLLLFTGNVMASFITYNGGTTAEADWRAAAGTTSFEDFESYAVGTQITSLPTLGVGFNGLAGGGYPVIYNHLNDPGGGTPYGSHHLANFPNGITETNRWDDIVLYVLPDVEITALGFWNGDGQRDTFTATIYDADDNILGTVGAFKGTFAGFVTDTAIARVVFDGMTGDGWNHLDGLQTNAQRTIATPLPATVLLMLPGLLGIVRFRNKV